MRKYAAALIVATFIMAGCAPTNSASTPTNESMVVTEIAPTLEAVEPTQISIQPTDDVPAPVQRATWQTLPLTDARTGAAFTLADFAGKTVLVEPMATWCTNCRQQLGNVTSAYSQLSPDEFVFVGISVAENITDADLSSYVDAQGFPFTFAIATPDMLTQLVEAFGRSSITPPSTPHFIIRPDGSVSELFTGSKSAADLVALMTAASEA